MKHHISILGLALLLASCEAIPVTEFTDRPVVCCYLSDGQSPTLSVQKLIPFQSDATFSEEDVSLLDITITDLTTGTDYPLSCSGEGTYVNTELTAVSGHEYRLSFQYDGMPVTATTSVPTPPQEVIFSSNTIEAMSFQPPKSLTRAPQEGIEITWKNDEGDYYIVEGRTSSTNPLMEVDEGDEMPSKSFKQSYTQGSGSNLSSSDFNYYGTYTVSVIHIREEYAIMSQGGSTGSTTLVDMKGNIDGGYGIFTGISCHCETITVKEGSSAPPF